MCEPLNSAELVADLERLFDRARRGEWYAVRPQTALGIKQMLDGGREKRAWLKDPHQFTFRVKEYRHRFDINLREMAEKVGVSPSTLSRIESGKTPDLKTALALIAVLGE